MAQKSILLHLGVRTATWVQTSPRAIAAGWQQSGVRHCSGNRHGNTIVIAAGLVMPKATAAAVVAAALAVVAAMAISATVLGECVPGSGESGWDQLKQRRLSQRR